MKRATSSYRRRIILRTVLLGALVAIVLRLYPGKSVSAASGGVS